MSSFFKSKAPGAALAVAVLLSSTALTPARAQSPELSANVGLTSDYIFRGVSQSDRHMAVQGGFDLAYGIFYAGVWGSNVDFGVNNAGLSYADIETDLYAGLKFKLMPKLEADIGAIYYDDPGARQNYFEGKFGLSAALTDNFSVSGTVFYSPDYYFQSGKTFTYEGGAELTLPADFKLSGTVGTVQFRDPALDDYNYWNVGISKDFLKKFTADVRYHGSNCTILLEGKDMCGNRVVGTISASF